jgi:hypothetical protein
MTAQDQGDPEHLFALAQQLRDRGLGAAKNSRRLTKALVSTIAKKARS